MHHGTQEGWIEVVTGSMFSGKTEEMLRRLRRARIARQQVQAFKPKLDVRYGQNKVTSHSGAKFDATAVTGCDEILDLLDEDTNVVAIDEAQFFECLDLPIDSSKQSCQIAGDLLAYRRFVEFGQ